MMRRTLVRLGSTTNSELATLKNSVSIVSGTPADQLKRKYIVYRPSPSVIQSAPGNNDWVVKVAEKGEKWTNPLMGWTSTADPLSHHKITFPSKEDAVNYCSRNGLDYDLVEPQEKKSKLGEKWYGQHFAYKAPNKWDSILPESER
mmetsp:Transcript_35843/g.93420  ORF Transcript_35843/g.93420 Transcript_35843/m.93420 type:complete len:146 (-) Transcript_35843:192-629(-)|eukprot:CAMPEP_0113869142 /NCGR_PEP_ID=MMETSP0780_2-20120614/1374_1 /TAXON_ID=652834 /ORGANISM="Palpitomonas bilix" /LENGTH=145 /DNA_ID=CAMNT_0000854291 /DNA_START=82 /DNA_END=519 /DNA_ORIENTATION=- /assembly_acc=CAM_ASM_000599